MEEKHGKTLYDYAKAARKHSFIENIDWGKLKYRVYDKQTGSYKLVYDAEKCENEAFSRINTKG